MHSDIGIDRVVVCAGRTLLLVSFRTISFGFTVSIPGIVELLLVIVVSLVVVDIVVAIVC